MSGGGWDGGCRIGWGGEGKWKRGSGRWIGCEVVVGGGLDEGCQIWRQVVADGERGRGVSRIEAEVEVGGRGG